jgi:hypothetical protein
MKYFWHVMSVSVLLVGVFFLWKYSQPTRFIHLEGWVMFDNKTHQACNAKKVGDMLDQMADAKPAGNIFDRVAEAHTKMPYCIDLGE